MVKARVPLAQGTGDKARIFGAADDFIPQRGIIGGRKLSLGRTEGSHGAFGALAGGDMKIVTIQNGVGGRDDENIGVPLSDGFCRFLHSAAGGGNGLFPSAADFRQQYGRVGR